MSLPMKLFLASSAAVCLIVFGLFGVAVAAGPGTSWAVPFLDVLGIPCHCPAGGCR